jgi:hypothetical protein
MIISKKKISISLKGNINFNVLFIFKILKAASQHLQKTIEFYSIVYVDSDENSTLKYIQVPSSCSKTFMAILFSRYTVILTTYSIVILFFPNDIILIRIMNYVFGLINVKTFFSHLWEICFSNENVNIKITKILDILKTIICNFILIFALNILFMSVVEIIKFEKNLSSLNNNNELMNKSNKSTMRKSFYFYLGMAFVILVCIHFGCAFSVGSKDSSIDPKDEQESEILSKDQNHNYETDTTFSRLMRYLGYQNIFENAALYDSLPYLEKTKILEDCKDIMENHKEILIYAALIAAFFVFLAAASSNYADNCIAENIATRQIQQQRAIINLEEDRRALREIQAY